jgi:hypothetical protein
VSADDRAAREQNVIDQVREWLPSLGTVGTRIVIEPVDPPNQDGAMFKVTRDRAFVCRRGDRPDAATREGRR